jgi:long-chain acyl-CoA synthetase
MLWHKKIRQATSSQEDNFLGRTLPSLLDEGCDLIHNRDAFRQWTAQGWQSFSNQEMRNATEDLALGFLHLGLSRGDRIALLMHSDTYFCMADMGSLLAGLVNVPIDLTQTLENIIATLKHSDARALVISNLDLLNQVASFLSQVESLRHVVVMQVPTQWQPSRSLKPDTLSDDHAAHCAVPSPAACLCVSDVHLQQVQRQWPYCIKGLTVWSLTDLRRQGQCQRSDEQLQDLRIKIQPHDLATLIYIPDEAGQPQGVMLTHENISANALAAFSTLKALKRGPQEVVLSFLPLNHVFARALLYGHMAYGHSIYFTSPHRVMKHLQDVSPTVLATVPLFLEKIYSKLLEAGHKPTRFKFQQWFQRWGLILAQRYELGRRPALWDAILLKLADPLIFGRWRSLFGGRLRYLLSGGAALEGRIASLFAAAGIRVLQGYGLTQTGAVVCVNREYRNYAGTVGIPIAGAQVKIAPDNEILVRGPSVTPGYFKNPELTRTLIDGQGWLHTGDFGLFSQNGYLKIIGAKKALFKLATGKYIAPLPMEQRLKQSPLVAQAVVVGTDRKFCGVLLFPNWQELWRVVERLGLGRGEGEEGGVRALSRQLSAEELLQHPWVLATYQAIVDGANCHLPYWALVKQFRLIPEAFAIHRGAMTAVGQLPRTAIIEHFSAEIDALYGTPATVPHSPAPPISPTFPSPHPPEACPTFAQSLSPKLTT